MRKIVFFSIPAYGHTNPTLAVVKALVQRGNFVRYYSFRIFQNAIEAVGAEFVPCDSFLPPLPPDFQRRLGYDFSCLVEMIADVTISMEQTILPQLQSLHPDCIVSDSLCIWGKLFAQRLHIPMVCSTTTFAFNKNTAKLMKSKGREAFYMLTGFPKILKKIRQLKDHGFPVSGLPQLIANDDETPTIVYTSRALQPMEEEFGSNYAFVGPSLSVPSKAVKTQSSHPVIYISLGTVMTNTAFYQNCIEAFRNCSYTVILSVGSQAALDALKDIPQHIQAEISVPQLQVLQRADVFLTHCGMNSAHESIYFGVPMVLYPQQSEQHVVADCLRQAGAGVPLDKATPDAIRNRVEYVLSHREPMQKMLQELAASFAAAGGAEKAASVIEQSCRNV